MYPEVCFSNIDFNVALLSISDRSTEEKLIAHYTINLIIDFLAIKNIPAEMCTLSAFTRYASQL